MDFEKSETLKNLTRAFASECQDGAKYQYIADEATQDKQSYVSTILKQLATNEMAHAKIFYDYIIWGYGLMRDIEKKILKSLEDDIKILKRANTKTNEIKDHIRNFRDFSNDNTEEYKKEIDKLMEGLK